MIKYVCDKCGVEISTDKEDIYNVSYYEYNVDREYFVLTSHEFCKKHYDEFISGREYKSKTKEVAKKIKEIHHAATRIPAREGK